MRAVHDSATLVGLDRDRRARRCALAVTRNQSKQSGRVEVDTVEAKQKMMWVLGLFS